MSLFQKVGQKVLNRSDHIWYKVESKYKSKVGHYKCCLCGAITLRPPCFPTPDDWMPSRYEKLTDEERDLCPYDGARV